MRTCPTILTTLRHVCSALVVGMAAVTYAAAASIHMAGAFTSDDHVQFLTVIMEAPGTLDIRSIGYAGGTSVYGGNVAAGGFDSMLFLYDAAGTLVAQSDDGIGAAIDTTTGLAADAGFAIALGAGQYKLALTQYDNFPLGNLADGFSRAGEGNFTPGLSGTCPAISFCDWSGAARSGSWRLNFLGASHVIDEPATWGLLAVGAAIAGVRRRRWRRVFGIGLTGLAIASGAGAAVSYHVESLDFPAADAAAVRLKITAPTSALALRSALFLNGQNITSAFVPAGGSGTMTATVSRLIPGTNFIDYFDGKASRTPRSQMRIEVIDQSRCSSAQLGTHIEPALIGEPVSGITLATPTWTAATASTPAYCRVNGSMAAIDPAAPPINFAVVLPSRWAHRAVQVGGGGLNGTIPGLTGGGGAGASFIARGWLVSGSDSGHSTTDPTWALNDESMKNLGYMQMKKTHDAAWVLSQRMYGAQPRYSYWFGGSQGGREGLTVAQRYPNDFDGVVITVPIVNFSSLMLSRALHRIQEIPQANWVTNAKVTAISAHVVKQCDALDGLNDGIINNYQACRALFDVKQGAPNRQPWAELRCPGGVDPNPSNTTVTACLTDGQISTMQFVHTRYFFATPLAHNNPSFGMWMANTDPSGNGMIATQRFRGQEGAAANAPLYSWLGGPGVLGFVYKDLGANALTYVEGGIFNDRRVEISHYLDATNPDLTPFFSRGGKLISVIGTKDTLASSGSQLDYYQSVIDRMGSAAVDASARLWVIPHADHGLGGSNHNRDGHGSTIPTSAIPNGMDRVTMIIDWVEKGIAPPLHAQVTSATRALPLCSYPTYPRYLGGSMPIHQASSYTCATN